MKVKKFLFYGFSLSCGLIMVLHAETIEEMMNKFAAKQRREIKQAQIEAEVNQQKRLEHIKNLNQQKKAALKKAQEVSARQRALYGVSSDDMPLASSSSKEQTEKTQQESQSNMTSFQELPVCNCDDPQYDYPKNFYYNSQHQKLMRFYPDKCRCVAQSKPTTVTVPLVKQQSTKQSKQTQPKFDIRY